MKRHIVIPSLLLTLFTVSCAQKDKNKETTNEMAAVEAMRPAAQAELRSWKKKDFKGLVEFQETAEGVKVTAHASGLAPNSTHGIHVHETGKCEAPKYKTAGDHYNPHKQPHGAPKAEAKHIGDLGNIKADETGVAHLELLLPHVSSEDFQNIIGRAVLIHAKADDLKSQPSGNSGDRIACGVIKSNSI